MDSWKLWETLTMRPARIANRRHTESRTRGEAERKNRRAGRSPGNRNLKNTTRVVNRHSTPFDGGFIVREMTETAEIEAGYHAKTVNHGEAQERDFRHHRRQHP